MSDVLDLILWGVVLVWFILPALAAWAIRRSKRTIWFGMAAGWVTQLIVASLFMVGGYIDTQSGEDGALEGPVLFGAFLATVLFTLFGGLVGSLSAYVSAQNTVTGKAT